MADNVTLNAMSGGTTVAADDISSVWHQRVKIQYGADGSATDVDVTTPVPVTLAQLEASKASVTGLSVVHKFGANPSVGVTEEDVWANGGAYPWPVTAETIQIKSGGNVNDDAAGTGAQAVTVEGLDGTWADASVTLTTAGAGASAASAGTFWRVFRAYNTDVGAYGGTNTGDIVIENTTATQVLANIKAGMGQSQMTMYTVPAGKTAYLAEINASVDSTKSIDLTMWQRRDADDVTTPFTGKRIVVKMTGLSGEVTRTFQSMPAFPAKTDLWWSAIIGSSTGAVEVSYDLYIVG